MFYVLNLETTQLARCGSVEYGRGVAEVEGCGCGIVLMLLWLMVESR